MRSFISCAVASRGGFCQATCRRGARSSAGSADGANEGLFETINHLLVMADRERGGREASPSAAVLDSQGAKTAESGGPRGTTLRR